MDTNRTCPCCGGRLISYDRTYGISYASCNSCHRDFEWSDVFSYWRKKEEERLAREEGSYEI